MLELRYYCRGSGPKEIGKLLDTVAEKCGLTYEIVSLSANGVYDRKREIQIFETDFKPRARVLSRRTGQSMVQLKLRGSGRHPSPLPDGLAITRGGTIEWFALGSQDIVDFLKDALKEGYGCLEERCKPKHFLPNCNRR